MKLVLNFQDKDQKALSEVDVTFNKGMTVKSKKDSLTYHVAEGQESVFLECNKAGFKENEFPVDILSLGNIEEKVISVVLEKA